MTDVAGGILELGGGQVVDLSGGVVRGPSGETRLEARLARLLKSLMAARGGIVARDTLVDEVWLGRPVGDDAIDSAICRLRSALGDQRKELIQTVPKRGYRFSGGRRRLSSGAHCARGELALELWDPASVHLALANFNAALEGNPNDARALSGAAVSRALLCLRGALPVHPELEAAAEQARVAGELDPRLGVANLALGVLAFLRDRNVAVALEALDLAVARCPSASLARVWRSQIYLAAGRMSAAIDDLAAALETDAANIGIRLKHIEALLFSRRFADCCVAADRHLVEVGPSLGALAYKGWALMFLGECASAVEVMASSWRAGPGRADKTRELKRAFSTGGQRGYFYAVAQMTDSNILEDVVRPIDRAALWAMAGEPNRALSALRLAEHRDDLRLRWISVMPHFDTLRESEGFRHLCNRHCPV